MVYARRAAEWLLLPMSEVCVHVCPSDVAVPCAQPPPTRPN